MAKEVKKTKDSEITDMLLDDFDKFEQFTVTYLKQIIAGCIAIIIIVAIVVVGYAIHSSAEKKADNVIAAANTIPELQQVIKEYAGRKAVWGAYQKLIKLQVGNKDFAAALDSTRGLLKLNVPEEMRWPLELNVGYLLEILNRKADAVEQFVTITKNNSFPANVRIEASYSAGRLELLLNNKVLAKSYLESAAKNQMGASAGEGGLWQKLAMAMLMNMQKPEPAKDAAVKTESAKAKPAKTAVSGRK